MPFHRYKTPAYNLLGGSFPGTVGVQTYGLVNVVSEGVGGGDGSAPADGAKQAPNANAGTYFVAFGENAQAAYVNRGLRAVVQNTDALDDVVRGSIPRVERVAITQSTDINEVTVTGDVFVGEYGTANTQENRDKLVHLEYSDGSPITDRGYGNYVKLLLIHDGSGNSIVGTSTTGFHSGATLRFDNPIYAGSYTAFLGRRTSYANMLEAYASTLVSEHIQGRHRDAQLWVGFGQGLRGCYNKSTRSELMGFESKPSYNVPGAGATIPVDGKAITLLRPYATPWEADTVVRDPARAALAFVPVDPAYRYLSGNYDSDVGGCIDIVHYQTVKPFDNGGGEIHGSPGRDTAATLVVNTTDYRSSSIAGTTARTYLKAETPAILNPGGLGAKTVRVADPYYFRSGGKTGLALKYDLLLITRTLPNGTVTTIPYLCSSIIDNQTVQVSALGVDPSDTASVPLAFPTNTAATITWLQVLDVFGGQGGEGYQETSRYPRVLSMSHLRNTSAAAQDGRSWVGGELIGAGTDRRERALTVGTLDNATGDVVGKVHCYTNGDIEQSEGYFYGEFAERRPKTPVTLSVASPSASMLIIPEFAFPKEFVVNGSGDRQISMNIDLGKPFPAGFTFSFTVTTGASTSGTVTLSVPSTSWLFTTSTDRYITWSAAAVYLFTVRYITDYVLITREVHPI